MCVVALAMSSGTALAHDPPEPPGTQLMRPIGELFWFVTDFQTAQNPFSPANTHVTSSDIAFWGDLAYVGDYGGFRIFDISRPTPTLVSVGIPVPAKDRYLLVNAYYRGGSAVIDFGDPTAPKEIAFADLDATNTWSAYTYPRDPGRRSSIPVYSNDGLSRNYGTAENPRFPEAAYGFQRFHAKVGPTTLVGLDRLNPQLQERVIPTDLAPRTSGRARPRTYAQGTPAPAGARGPSARPWEK